MADYGIINRLIKRITRRLEDKCPGVKFKLTYKEQEYIKLTAEPVDPRHLTSEEIECIEEIIDIPLTIIHENKNSTIYVFKQEKKEG